jgi:hypothetical protein
MNKNLDASDTFSNIKLILQWIERFSLSDDTLIMECDRKSLLASHWWVVSLYSVSCVILKAGVVRLSFWATEEEGERKR